MTTRLGLFILREVYSLQGFEQKELLNYRDLWAINEHVVTLIKQMKLQCNLGFFPPF